MGWTAPATVTVGQVLTAAFWNQQVRDNELDIDANMWKKLAGTVLGADTASFDFTSITQTYRHLRLIMSLRSSVAAGNEAVYVSYNTDVTAANYDSELLIVAGTVATNPAENRAAAAGRSVGWAIGNTGQANAFASGEVLLADYANTARMKVAQWMSSIWTARTAGAVAFVNGFSGWASVAAISRITLTPAGGGNFKAGSSVDLYGIK